MGQLSESTFAAALAPCATCGCETFDVRSYVDRSLPVMLAEKCDDGRWVYDGEKFVDGVYEIACTNGRHRAFASPDCPRCHAPNTLLASLKTESNLPIPRRCPACQGTEFTVTGLTPAMVIARRDGRVPAPKPLALVGDEGFHAAVLMCDSCDHVEVAPGCPLCGNDGPLRKRP